MRTAFLSATSGTSVLGVALISIVSSFAASPSALAGTHRIAIENMKFVPESVEVKAGDTVIWENRDIVPHTVTASAEPGEKRAFDSGPLTSGKKFKWRFKKAGTFPYTCIFHPTMKATIKVSK